MILHFRMSGTYYFVIVGHSDNPLFELEFSSGSSREVFEHLDIGIMDVGILGLSLTLILAWTSSFVYLALMPRLPYEKFLRYVTEQ